jgi:hypothetical protein
VNKKMIGTYLRKNNVWRDHGLCQVKTKCAGVKCEWEQWQADYIIPWSRGGKTTVANGQVACVACNVMKSDG